MMLEKLTKDELDALLEELKENGYDVRQNNKGTILRDEARKLGMVNAFMSTEIKKPIFDLADKLTNNFEKRGSNMYKRKTVDLSIDTEYRKICSNLLKAIQSYYGRCDGFREGRYKAESEE